MSMQHHGHVCLAFIIGGIVGAGLAILYAPATGKETRKKLKGFEDDLVSKAEDLVSKGGEILSQQRGHIYEVVHAAGKEIKNAGKHFENIGR